MGRLQNSGGRDDMFIPTAELLPTYQTMEEHIIYGSAVEFDKLIDKLKRLQERLRRKHFN